MLYILFVKMGQYKSQLILQYSSFDYMNKYD